MSYNVVFAQGTVTVAVPAGERIAVQAYSNASVFQEVGFPQFPEANDLLAVVSNTTYVSGAFTNATNVIIQAGASGAAYAVGVSPVISDSGKFQTQGTPVAVNVTGPITAAALLGGIVTSTTAAAVDGTVPTGTVMEAASEWQVNDSVDWAVINLGPDVFDVVAAADHTIVRGASVAAGQSGTWRTRKTATNTFVSYRIG
jgi:hypothetical protein